jgi:hypothetical protein
MAGQDVRVVIDDAQVRALCSADNPAIAAIMDHAAAVINNGQKVRCPVSRVYPVYASGGATVAGGRRLAGDFPLRPSGYLRSSIRSIRQPDGAIWIGPTADYGGYVNDGTVPHVIESSGPWPLRNRATGQVFGRVVHHPGTRAVHFVEDSLHDIDGAVYHIE